VNRDYVAAMVLNAIANNLMVTSNIKLERSPGRK